MPNELMRSITCMNNSKLKKRLFIALAIGVNNLLNTDYKDIGNIQLLGRWLREGVNFAF